MVDDIWYESLPNQFALQHELIQGEKRNQAAIAKRFGSSPVKEAVPYIVLNDGRNPGIADLEKDNVRNTNFFSSSINQRVLDRNAMSPMETELSARNAQTMVPSAWRVLSSFFDNVESKESSLFKIDSDIEGRLGHIANQQPYMWNREASNPLSAYWGDTVASILSDEMTPEGWTTEAAIEEFRKYEPEMAEYMDRNGVDWANLADLSKKGPANLRYYLANTIDAIAAARVMEDFAAESGAIRRSFWNFAYPLVQQSLNSNDTLSEIMGVMGVSAASLGLAAIPAVVGAAASRGYKALKAANTITGMVKDGTRTLEVIKKASKYGNRATDSALTVNRQLIRGLHTVAEYSPTRLTDHIADALKSKGLVAKNPTKLVNLGLRFGTESVQGAIESVVWQSREMHNGNQDFMAFDMSEIGYNMLEEGVGGVTLGYGLNFALKQISWMGKKVNGKLDPDRKLMGAMQGLGKSYVANTSARTREAIMLLTIEARGRKGVDADKYGSVVKFRAESLDAADNLGIRFDDDSDETWAALGTISGAAGFESAAMDPVKRATIIEINRMQELGRANGNTDFKLSREEILAFAGAAVEGMASDPGANKAIVEAVVTSFSGKSLSAMSEEEINEVSVNVKSTLNGLAAKVGMGDIEMIKELANYSGVATTKDEAVILREVLEDNADARGGMLIEGTNSTVPVKPKESTGVVASETKPGNPVASDPVKNAASGVDVDMASSLAALKELGEVPVFELTDADRENLSSRTLCT